jgi:hypothetical protein
MDPEDYDAARQQAIEGQARVDALHALVEQIYRDDPELWKSEQHKAAFEVGHGDGLTPSAIERLVKRETRTMWTTPEKLIVGGCIAGGVATLQFAGLGLIPIGIGLWVRRAVNKRNRQQIRARMSAEADRGVS